MSMHSNQVGAPHGLPIPGVITQAGYFLLHFLEMCVVICAGAGFLLMLMHRGAALVEYPDRIERYPEANALILAMLLTTLVYTWMGIRGHNHHLSAEMASTSFIALILLLGGDWLGIVPNSRLFILECGLACVLMLIPMLYSLDEYTGSRQQHIHTAFPTEESSWHGG